MNSPLKNAFIRCRKKRFPSTNHLVQPAVKIKLFPSITDLYNYILDYNSISQKNQQFLNISVTIHKIFLSARSVVVSDGIIDGLLDDNIRKLIADILLIRRERLVADDRIDHLVRS